MNIDADSKRCNMENCCPITNVEVCESPRTPFVHKFQTSRNKYVMDVNTNRILRLDSLTWDIIDEFGIMGKSDIISKYTNCFSQSEITAAYDAIAKTQQHSNMLLPPPRQLFQPQTSDEVSTREALEHKRRLLTLCVTEECNFRCSYCNYGDGYSAWRNHSKRKMTWEVARLAIDDYILHSDACHDVRSIGFYGGEPLLNFKLIKRCLAYTRDKLADKVVFNITTNGSLLRGKVAELLASERFDILVSLDGPRHIHNSCRRFVNGSPTWELVMKNVKRFVEQYPKYRGGDSEGHYLAFSVVLSPLQNALNVEEFFRLDVPFTLKCNPSLALSQMDDLGSYYMESLVPEDRIIPGLATLRKRYLDNVANGAICRSPEEYKWRFQRFLFDRAFWLFLRRRIASSKRPILEPRAIWDSMCIPGGSRFFVNVDGSYYPCERVPCSENLKIGNVWDGIDFSAAYDLRKKIFELCKDECKYCWCVNFCYASCCSNMREGTRITAKAKRRECDKYREKTHRLLTQYFEVVESNPHAFDYLKK